MEHRLDASDLANVVEVYKASLIKAEEEAIIYKVLVEKYCKEIEVLQARINELESK